MATEKRLIYMEDAKEALIGWETDPTDEEIEYTLDHLPKVDAVEVVRCRDCKRYDNSEGICWCKLNSRFFPGGLDWHGFPEDGFCSYGERKDDDIAESD